ncbi:MAG: hypothetical protein H6Q69_1094 [Firmicutes bacterium]|nr:hypothetical protein [Bacillota bacterium]
MRRILGLVLLLIMMPCLTPSSAEAKIKSDYNNFTNLRTYSSTYRDISSFDYVVLTKNLPKEAKDTSYLLSFGVTSLKEWFFFSSNGASIKIDDGEIQHIPSLRTNKNYIPSRVYPTLNTSTILDVSNVIDKIKDAEDVVIRVTFTNQPYVDYKVSIDQLIEWKKLISMER